jgi:hypothetical protein
MFYFSNSISHFCFGQSGTHEMDPTFKDMDTGKNVEETNFVRCSQEQIEMM